MTCEHCGGRIVRVSDVTFSDGWIEDEQCLTCARPHVRRTAEEEASLRAEMERKPGQRNFRSAGIPQMMLKKGSRFSRGEYR